MEPGRAAFEYKGRFYARPAYRGISLEDLAPDSQWSDDLQDIVYGLVRKALSQDSGVSGIIDIRIEVRRDESV